MLALGFRPSCFLKNVFTVEKFEEDGNWNLLRFKGGAEPTAIKWTFTFGVVEVMEGLYESGRGRGEGRTRNEDIYQSCHPDISLIHISFIICLIHSFLPAYMWNLTIIAVHARRKTKAAATDLPRQLSYNKF
jgi:hypothetical protein